MINLTILRHNDRILKYEEIAKSTYIHSSEANSSALIVIGIVGLLETNSSNC